MRENFYIRKKSKYYENGTKKNYYAGWCRLYEYPEIIADHIMIAAETTEDFSKSPIFLNKEAAEHVAQMLPKENGSEWIVEVDND